MKRFRSPVLAALFAVFGALLARAGGEAAATITPQELREHVNYLASDELQGRDSGSPGERLAGEYLARAFAQYGLEPMGEDGSFFLPFEIAGDAKLTAATLRIERGEFHRDFATRTDMNPFPFSATGELDVPLVFAGYGITDPQRDYDDYAGLDVKGKAVLVLRHEPRENPRAFTPHAHFTTKAQNAKKHGAVAMIVVTDPVNHAGDEDLLPFGGGGDDLGVVAVHVRQSLAQGLFRLAGKDLAATQRKIDEGLKPDSFDLGARVKVKVGIDRQKITARNVIARLPGSDPKLKEEIVVIGAHYDHVGLGDHGSLAPGANQQIHNGADDNASGTAGMLELAQAFATSGVRPKRTILFMGFSGEERGLLGSEHFVANTPWAREKIVAMINLDMIGRLRDGKLEVGGVGTSPGFKDLVQEALKVEALQASLDPSGYGPSDHASFYAAKIPVLFFFTGIHEDYHRPGDDADKFVADGAAKVARAAYVCAERLANADTKPAYVEVARGTRADRPRLGIMLDRSRASGGVGVQTVVDRGPAAAAGIKQGDVIVKIGDVAVDTAEDLLEALGKAKFDDKVPVVVLRGTERVTLEVTLTRP